MTKLRHAIGVACIIISLLLMIAVHWPDRYDIRRIEFPGSATIDQGLFHRSRGSIWLKIPLATWIQQTISLQLHLDFENPPGYQTIASRLDLPGTRISPKGLVERGISSDKTVDYSWKIEALSQGNFEGTIWIYLTEPIDENQPASKTELLGVIPIQFVSRSVIGLGWRDIQVLSGALLIIGLAMIHEVFSALINKIKRKSDQSNS